MTPRPQVLIVDDDADTREVFGIALREWGFEVRSAESGSEALAVAAQWRPAIAMIDVGLPGMDGYELARRLRDVLGAGLGLVAFTGYARTTDRDRAFAAGFDRFVVKGHEEGLREVLEEVARRAPQPPGAELRKPPHREHPLDAGATGAERPIDAAAEHPGPSKRGS